MEYSSRILSVYPATGVPPVDVLAVLFPDLPTEKAEKLTLEEYNALKAGLAQAVQDRADAIAGGGKRIFISTVMLGNAFRLGNRLALR